MCFLKIVKEKYPIPELKNKEFEKIIEKCGIPSFEEKIGLEKI